MGPLPETPRRAAGSGRGPTAGAAAAGGRGASLETARRPVLSSPWRPLTANGIYSDADYFERIYKGDFGAKYLEENAIPWTNLSGEETQELASKYGVRGIPTMMLVDQEGKIVMVGHQSAPLAEKAAEMLKDAKAATAPLSADLGGIAKERRERVGYGDDHRRLACRSFRLRQVL